MTWQRSGRASPGRIILITAFALGWLGPLAGCGSESSEAETPQELVILCGSSFVPPMQELCEQFTASSGVRVVTTTAGSEDLLPLIKAGRQGDIVITHDPYLDYVREAGALADSAQVGFVAPVLAVRPGNPKGLRRIEDLARPGLRVALSNPEYSTCGEMVFALLAKKGIKEAVMANVENRLTKGHANLGTLVQTDAVDAVIMWNGVANMFKDSLDTVPTPYEYDTEIRVHVIGLNYSKNPTAMKQFIELAKSRGRDIFARHGYTK